MYIWHIRTKTNKANVVLFFIFIEKNPKQQDPMVESRFYAKLIRFLQKQWWNLVVQVSAILYHYIFWNLYMSGNKYKKICFGTSWDLEDIHTSVRPTPLKIFVCGIWFSYVKFHIFNSCFLIYHVTGNILTSF